VDRTGQRLQIVQVLPTPRRTAPAATPTATVTPLPSNATVTVTPTPTSEPIDCGAVAPLVDVVRSPTSGLSQTITGIDLALGPFTIILACSEGGCSTVGLSPNHSQFHPFAVDIDLQANTVHHVEVCAINNICHDVACTSVAANGEPLEIVQHSAAVR